MPVSKTAFISYSHKDEDTALKIATSLQERLGKEIWIDFFDLDAGDEFALKIAGAIQRANWFILIASEDSLKSKWVRFEANLATFQSIEKEDFKIITVKIDNIPIPDPLKIILESRIYIDAVNNLDSTISKISELISKEISTRLGKRHIFFDRGNEIDRLQIIADQSKIILLIGFYGIGKTSLIEEAARNRFGRPFIHISLRKGHDLEILSRQIIAQTEYVQPDNTTNSNTLADIALQQFLEKQRIDGSFLVLDDFENTIDEEGCIRPYILDFINKYLAKSFSFPVILISTRKPDIPIDILDKCNIFKIDELPNEYMAPLIKQWYRSSKGEDVSINSIDFDKLTKSLGGLPLAARLISSYLILYSPSSILKTNFIAEFKHRVVEYILRDVLKGLTQIDKTILQIIAVTELGISIEDLLSASSIKSYDLSLVQKTINKLTDALLISQEADVLKLFSFMQEYFLRDIEDNKNFKLIAGEIGQQLYNKLNSLQSELIVVSKDKDPKKITFLNKKLFHYAVTSHRLLLFSGNKDKADRIPFKLSGHIRELVLMSYQRFKDFSTCLEYANKWLELEPDDTEIALYKARSLRRLERYKEAETILLKLYNYPNKHLRARIDRERGLIAKDNNRITEAIKYFRKACVRTQAGTPIYALALADLANALLIESDNLSFEDIEETKLKSNYEEALKLLIETQERLPRFDEIHLSYIIEALIHLGKNSEAEEKLENALIQNPDDPHLLIKKANLLSSIPGRNIEALEYANKALGRNLDWAYTIKAKILLNEKRYDEALENIEQYRSQSPRDKIFVTDLKARILIGLGKYSLVRTFIDAQHIENNRFIDYDRILNEIKCAQSEFNAQNYDKAKASYEKAALLFDSIKNKYTNIQGILNLKKEIDEIGEIIKKITS